MANWFIKMFGGVEPQFDKPVPKVGIDPRVEKIRVAGTPCLQLTVDEADAALFGKALDVMTDGFNKQQRYVASSMCEKFRNANCPVEGE